MIALLMRAGLTERLATFLAWAALIVLALLALWWLRADAYADGVRATDAKWEAAGRALERKAEKAADRADGAAEQRAADYAEQVLIEKEKLDEAERAGSSPFDVLFPGGDGVR